MYNENALVRANILISPFTYRALDDRLTSPICAQTTTRVSEVLRDHLGRDYQYTMSGRSALDLVLLDLRVAADDVITIIPSIGNFYVSSCVTRTIERHCNWSMKVERKSRAILVIHEWGKVHRKLHDMRKYGLPIIEDCAYSFASSTSEYKAGRQGTYAIYSLSKFFPINFGGIVCGLTSQKSDLSDAEVGYICSMLGSSGSIEMISSQRRAVWGQMTSLFSSVGAGPAFALEEGDIPGVFMFGVHEGIEPDDVKARYAEHGIESSVYYGSRNVFVPCHQNLGPQAVRYIYDVYQNMLRHAENCG